jgi:hypothetical protein
MLSFLHGFLGDVRRMVEQRIGRPSLDVRDRTGNYSSVWLPLAVLGGTAIILLICAILLLINLASPVSPPESPAKSTITRLRSP